MKKKIKNHQNYYIKLNHDNETKKMQFLVTDSSGTITQTIENIAFSDFSAENMEQLSRLPEDEKIPYLHQYVETLFHKASPFDLHVQTYQGQPCMVFSRYGLQGGGRVLGFLAGATQTVFGIFLITTGAGAVPGAALVSSGLGGSIYSLTTEEFSNVGFAKQSAISGITGLVTGGLGSALAPSLQAAAPALAPYIGAQAAAVAPAIGTGLGAGIPGSMAGALAKGAMENKMPTSGELIQAGLIGGVSGVLASGASELAGKGAEKLANKLATKLANKFITENADDVIKAIVDVAGGGAGGAAGGAASNSVHKVYDNYSKDKPLAEGVGKAAGEGALAGGVLGAAFAAGKISNQYLEKKAAAKVDPDSKATDPVGKEKPRQVKAHRKIRDKDFFAKKKLAETLKANIKKGNAELLKARKLHASATREKNEIDPPIPPIHFQFQPIAYSLASKLEIADPENEEEHKRDQLRMQVNARLRELHNVISMPSIFASQLSSVPKEVEDALNELFKKRSDRKLETAGKHLNQVARKHFKNGHPILVAIGNFMEIISKIVEYNSKNVSSSEAINEVIDEVKTTAEKAGNTVKKMAEETANKMKTTCRDTVNGIEKAIRGIHSVNADRPAGEEKEKEKEKEEENRPDSKPIHSRSEQMQDENTNVMVDSLDEIMHLIKEQAKQGREKCQQNGMFEGKWNSIIFNIKIALRGLKQHPQDEQLQKNLVDAAKRFSKNSSIRKAVEEYAQAWSDKGMANKMQ